MSVRVRVDARHGSRSRVYIEVAELIFDQHGDAEEIADAAHFAQPRSEVPIVVDTSTRLGGEVAQELRDRDLPVLEANRADEPWRQRDQESTVADLAHEAALAPDDSTFLTAYKRLRLAELMRQGFVPNDLIDRYDRAILEDWYATQLGV